MFRKSAIALGLAMVAGTGLAAQGASSMNTGHATSNDMGSAGAGMSARAMFNRLDTNDDGLLSRAEASRNSRISRMYDSLDTSATIESGADVPAGNGISLEQFEAGVQAAHSGSGAVGPAVSGGETYTLMKDGSKRMRDASGNMQRDAGDATSGMQQRGNDRMNRDRSSIQRKGNAMRDDATQQGQSTRNRMNDSMPQRGTGRDRMNRKRMQQSAPRSRDNGMNDTGKRDTQDNY